MSQPKPSTPISSVQDLIKHLQAQGVETGAMKLVAHVRHLHAGERDHYSGMRVQVFHPVATQLDFVIKNEIATSPNGSATTTPPTTPLLTATYGAETVKKDEYLIEADAFNSHVKVTGNIALPVGVEAVAGDLMRSMIDKHREITGQITSTYEKIEVKPGMIESIKRERFDLEIGLERLAKYLELEKESWTLFLTDRKGQSARDAEIGFEKMMLTERFIKDPCSKELYMDLRREFVADRITGMSFIDYYEWYRGSAAKLDASGQLTGETRDSMEKAIKAWHATGGDRDNFKENMLRLASRNFEIHPRHTQVVEQLIDEVVAELDRSQTSKPRL